ncbi:glycosyl hydrolase [Austwickia sp. TVS 96-490-7B]|uniref:glycoside hydrolase 5 family protein n=1 Tax=Austwickia sp. TVS 96-490-7B TaxID=2830843 RepID=UPI0021020276|nr:glycosyl hydrolase [Austwickia sp. TVS 96-490-7B]
MGANYVPSTSWFYSWLDLDLDDVRRDLDDLAELGLDHIRVFPIWPWIQPNRSHIRPRAMDDVASVLDLAHERGLAVCLDLVQGHLSSFDFLPSWILTWHSRSLFTDDTVRAGLRDYVRTMCRTLGAHPALFAITTGNELNNLWPSNETSPSESLAWAQDLVGIVAEEVPQVAALHSLFSAAWTDPGHPFTPVEAARVGDWTSVHSWIFNGPTGIAAYDDEICLSWADYLVQLAVASADDPHRPVWLQEVGAPGPEVPAEQAGEFARAVLARVLDEPRLVGVTWWSSHDVSRDLVDFPEREYDLGLFTTDHRPKPVAAVLAELVAQGAPNAVERTRCVDIPLSVTHLDEQNDARAALAAGSAWHRSWVQERREGPVGVRFVPSV